MNFNLTSLFKKLNIRVSNSTPAILKNKMILYVVFTLAILHSYQLWMSFDYTGFSVFLIIALASSYLTRNMTVILLIGLIGSHIYKYGLKGAVEGMENEGDEEKEKKEGEEEGMENEGDEEKKEGDEEKKEETTSTENFVPANLDDLMKSFNELSKESKGTNVAGLSDQTKNLLSQQAKLLENMKTLEPMLKKAENMSNQEGLKLNKHK